MWAEKIAGADSVDALMDLYQVASTNPEWETSIKPMFSARKEKLQATADAHNAGEQEPLDAEIVEPDTAA